MAVMITVVATVGAGVSAVWPVSMISLQVVLEQF
jgi:hypothetical protein